MTRGFNGYLENSRHASVMIMQIAGWYWVFCCFHNMFKNNNAPIILYIFKYSIENKFDQIIYSLIIFTYVRVNKLLKIHVITKIYRLRHVLRKRIITHLWCIKDSFLRTLLLIQGTGVTRVNHANNKTGVT